MNLRAVETAPAAFELKFVIAANLAARVQAWAQQEMTPDPHTGSDCGSYRVRTLYLDSARYDFLRRSDAPLGGRFRYRTYGPDADLFLERKKRRGCRIWKRREEVTLPAGAPTTVRIPECLRVPGDPLDLRPVILTTYRRLAFVAPTAEGTTRLTIDTGIKCVDRCELRFDLPTFGLVPVLDDAVVLELKFQDEIPGLFLPLFPRFGLIPGGFSKYRMSVARSRLGTEFPELRRRRPLHPGLGQTSHEESVSKRGTTRL